MDGAQRFIDRLDRALTGVLLVLVVAMVLSITTEIVLNAAVQPAASRLLKALGEGGGAAVAAEAARPSPAVRFVEGVMRFVAQASAPVNTASQTLLVWLGILGSALAFRQRAHLGVDTLVCVYPPRLRLALDYVSTALVGAFSLCVLVVGGFLVCRHAFSFGSKMPGFENINRGWFYLVLVLTGLLNLIYCAYHFRHPRPAGAGEPDEQESSDS